MVTEAAEPLEKLPDRLSKAYGDNVDYRRETALRLWLAFLLTFGFLRLLTHGIRDGWLPVHNVVTSDGLHIHHFVWGIALVLVTGVLSLSVDQARWHPVLAIPFGVGAALIIDEYALWLTLKDVYWTKEGRASVDLAIVIAAALGLYYAAACFWKTAVNEIRQAVALAVRGERRLLGRARRH